MADVQITGADIEAIATKLDGMDFTDEERAALAAVFQIAGSTISGLDDSDVEGFALNAYRNASFSFSLADSQGILIGLNQGLTNPGIGGGGVGNVANKLGGSSWKM